MAVRFDLPPDLERSLRQELRDLDAQAKQALMVELYRRGTITHFELAQALGLGRIETEGVLKRHNVTEDLPTSDEIVDDVANLRRLINPQSSSPTQRRSTTWC